MKLITPEIVGLFFIDLIFFIFFIISFIISLQIVKNWNINSTSTYQYNLEKRSYLVATILKYIFLVKIALFFYFIYILDDISNLLPGAMCAAGVVNATKYGTPLLLFKIFNIYLFGLWIIIHNIDLNKPLYPYTKFKFLLFIIIFPFALIELILEILHFLSINPTVIVSCCGSLFSTSTINYQTINFEKIPLFVYAIIFYINYILFFSKKFFAILNITFLITSIISLIYFFSPYIYELPTHHCPFCMLQKDYYFIGYFLYTFLFLGTFFGIAFQIAKDLKDKNYKKYMKLSLIFNTLYVLVISYFPIIYFIKNHTLI